MCTETVVKQATFELQSRLDRKNNIVCYTVAEHDSNLKDDCVRKHIEFIDSLCTDLGVEVQKDDVKNLKRIGKKWQKKTINNTETVIPRILIATLTEGQGREMHIS